jgi:hypothetical protein
MSIREAFSAMVVVAKRPPMRARYPGWTVAPSQSQPIRRSLVDGQLLPQGEVLEGEMVVATAQEREEPEQMEQEGDHRAGFSLDSSRLINHLVADGIVAKDARDDVQG